MYIAYKYFCGQNLKRKKKAWDVILKIVTEFVEERALEKAFNRK